MACTCNHDMCICVLDHDTMLWVSLRKLSETLRWESQVIMFAFEFVVVLRLCHFSPEDRGDYQFMGTGDYHQLMVIRPLLCTCCSSHNHNMELSGRVTHSRKGRVEY